MAFVYGAIYVVLSIVLTFYSLMAFASGRMVRAVIAGVLMFLCVQWGVEWLGGAHAD